jgi:predicted nucleotidyltransferase
LEEGLLSIVLSGALSSGEPSKAEIFLPHPYTFAMMKLFAFRDRVEDADKDFGRYHALDLYTILATTTEDEWAYALKLRDQNRSQQILKAGKQPARLYARSLFCPWALHRLGMTAVALSKLLGLSQPAITRADYRGEAIAAASNLELVEKINA